MSEVLGYFGDEHGDPLGYLDTYGLVVFSNKKKDVPHRQLGGYKDMMRILSNPEYYVRMNLVVKNRKQKGGSGFFGESNGKCGWGDGPSCCFYDCAPLWRTSVWPFGDTSM